MTHPDDDLRSLLRGADPAARLAPLQPDRITAMANTATSQPTSASRPRSPRRPLLFGLAGAGGLAAAVIAVATLTPMATTAATRVTMGADPGLAAGSCPGVLPEYLADWKLAFQARAEKVTDDLVTLQVTEVFRGEPGAVVEVTGHELSDSDYSGFGFTPGDDYLITVMDAASGETPQIALCGFSGPASPELRAVYEAAFG